MTLKKFFDEAAKIKFEMNGVLVRDESGDCPICSVANKILGTDYNNYEWNLAAARIMLSYRTALRIVIGSDLRYKNPKNRILVLNGLNKLGVNNLHD